MSHLQAPRRLRSRTPSRQSNQSEASLARTKTPPAISSSTVASLPATVFATTSP
jgi:hypothetical protein